MAKEIRKSGNKKSKNGKEGRLASEVAAFYIMTRNSNNREAKLFLERKNLKYKCWASFLTALVAFSKFYCLELTFLGMIIGG